MAQLSEEDMKRVCAALVQAYLEKGDDAEEELSSMHDMVQMVIDALDASKEYALVPRKPTESQILNMALTYDHGLGVPGYYDSPLTAGTKWGVQSHTQYFADTVVTMKKLYEVAICGNDTKPKSESTTA